MHTLANIVTHYREKTVVSYRAFIAAPSADDMMISHKSNAGDNTSSIKRLKHHLNFTLTYRSLLT